jgi:N-acetyl-anhydromuramyl-L-alanine amidase AmpD
MNIQWKGNEHTNKSSREGVKPFVIVDHIAEATIGSVDNWFTDPGNDNCSAHFCVGKNGEIHQYVKIEDYAWANGLAAGMWNDAPAKVVRDMNCNPNYYTISIEHEGTDGDLTDDQFYASAWLHRYIMDYVKNTFGVTMTLGNYNVIGHNQVDPKRKPCCPGDKFPWDRLYTELAKAEKMTLKEYEMELDYVRSGLYGLQFAFQTAARVKDLSDKLNGQYQAQAIEKLSKIGRFLVDNELMNP